MSVETSEPAVVRSDRARLRIVAATAAAVIVVDQITKILAVAALEDGPVDLFWTLRLRLIYNFGVSFGVGAGLGRWLGIVILLVVVGVIHHARTVEDRVTRVLLGGIVGGAIGNLVDRVFRADDGFLSGGVVDFIDLQWWPVFNVADIAVVCCAVGLMLHSLRISE